MSFIWLVLIVQLLACDAAWYDSVAAHTRLPYSKSTSDCYGGLTRTHKTVITTLLHSTAFAESRLAQTLPNLLAHTAADVGFFHTGWSDDNIVDLRIKLPFVSFITCVATSDWAAPDFRPGEFVQTKYHNAGYRSMCRWYSSRLFRALAYMQYEWVIRVDNDSAFPKVIPYDIIGVMEERGAKYGFRVMSPDGSEVTQALPEAAKYWLVSEGVTPTFLLESCNPSTMDGLSSDGWSKHIFYNNFFVTNVGFWVRPDVQSWLKLLEYLNGFYKFRWGDAPVHTVTLGMFSPKKELLEFGFEYEHQGNFSADKSYALLSELDFVTEPT